MAEIETSTAQFFSLITATGLEKLRPRREGAGVSTVELAKMAVGDGAGNPVEPSEDMTSLVNEQWRGGISELEDDPDNPTYKVIEAVIPFNEGGWFVREIGIYDTDGDLFAIGNMPPEYKPAQHEGALRDLVIRFYIELSNAGNVTLNIDPGHVVATRKWVVDVAIPDALTTLDEKVDEAAEHADRAEVARDIAQLAVGIFDTQQEGIDATDSDAFFWVAIKENEDLVALYKNTAGTAEFYGTYSSGKAYKLLAERLNNVARASSRPARLQREFHGNNSDSPAYSMTDSAGNKLITIEPNGRVSTNPGPARREFHTGRRSSTASVQLAAESGAIALELDERGQPISRWIKEFHGNGLPDWGYINAERVLIYGGNRDGSRYYETNSGSDVEFINLPTSSRNVKEGDVWDNYGAISLPRRDNASLYGVVTDVFPNGHTDGYALLDQMKGESPAYIDSSVIGHDSLGNEIREYTFFNPAYVYHRTERRAERPTIVLLGNIHGSETGASAANFQFVWNLVHGWRNSEIMSWLRWNANIVFVPFICPDGYDRRRRQNPNGVNLNRNFPAGWEESTASDKGDSPGSELETQAVMGIPARYPDGVYIGHHNFSFTSDEILLWIGALSEPGFKIAEAVSDDVNQLARREYEGLSDDLNTGNGVFRLADLINGGMDRYIYEQGCEAFLLETRFGSWGPPREARQQLGTRAIEFMCKRICEQRKQFSI